MSGNIRNTTILLSLLAFMTVGCKHYAAFPEIDQEGELVADEQNVSYDDSVVSGPKSILPVKSEASQKAVVDKQKEKQVVAENTEIKEVNKKEEKPEISQAGQPEPQKDKENVEKKEVVAENKKDLTAPDPEVEELPESEVTYNVIGKTTPSVIADMDLKEMDAEDNKPRVIKPIVKTTTILPVKKERKIIQTQTVGSSEPSVFYLAETVYFNNGGSAVDSKYFGKLRSVVKEAKAHNGKIIVQGFASSRTRNTDIVTHKMANLKVSAARADNVAKVLARYGMSKSRIITEGLSDSRPAYQEVMPEGERLNRRAEIYISY